MNSLLPRLPFFLLCATPSVLLCATDTGNYNMPTAVDGGGMSATGIVIATAAQVRAAFGTPQALVFTEPRERPVSRFDAMPASWLDRTDAAQRHAFRGAAQPGEFFVFQVVVCAVEADAGPLAMTMSELKTACGAAVPASAVRCFNLGGTDFTGHQFQKDVVVRKGRVQPLWCGIEVSATATGSYTGSLRLMADGKDLATVAVMLDVSGAVLDDHGDADPKRLSRLCWLDSTIGLDDDVVTAPFTPIVRKDTTLGILGRTMTLGPLGLPAAARSHFSGSNTRLESTATSVLASAFSFVVETDQGPVVFKPEAVSFTRCQSGAVEWTCAAHAAPLHIEVHGLLEFDGFADYHVTLKADSDVVVKDVRIEAEYAPAVSKYFMGLNHQGGIMPKDFDWTWDAKNNQDGWWIGAVNAGMKVRLKGTNFRTPLINAYYHFREINVPESWGNEGKGGIRLRLRKDGGATLTAFSGGRTVRKGSSVAFNFDLFLTPFKPVDTEAQWSLRYIHPHQGMEDPHLREPALCTNKGANVVNIHHNQEPNPTINYPYFEESFPILKNYVARAHDTGLKVKIYYTTREITSNLPELFPLHSLDGEIICPGPGRDARPITNGSGPHPWLVENLRENFIPAWRETLKGRYGGRIDLAVITTPDSRLDNFFMEGLAFTIRHARIDGLYIDDTALGRKSFQRARRIFDAMNPGAQIDMHSWSHFNGYAGMTHSSYVFMGNYPYYNKIWHGEGFNCNSTTPDFWLVEMAGIPYGLMSEMLDSPNQWRGMVFGQTTRLAWSGDPRNIWAFWDEHGMKGTEMVGWWDAKCPVKTDNPDVLATVYKGKDHAVIAVASWASAKTNVTLKIDWKKLGLPKSSCMFAPAVANFQPAMNLDAKKPRLPVQPGKGWLLVIRTGPLPKIDAAAPPDMQGVRETARERFDATLGGAWKTHVSKRQGTRIGVRDGVLKIDAASHTVACIERAVPAGTCGAEILMNSGTDRGQSWGVGVALAWHDGTMVRLNFRAEDANFGIDGPGGQQLLGMAEPGMPTRLRIVFDDKTGVTTMHAWSEDFGWRTVGTATVSTREAPASVRIGKWAPNGRLEDNGDPGSTGASSISELVVYGR